MSIKYLIVPGLGDSDACHWQSLWHCRLHSARVGGPVWQECHIELWKEEILAMLAEMRAAPILVAHGYGCLAAVASARRAPNHIRGLFLVAPRRAHEYGNGDGRLAMPSRVMASASDPNLTLAEARAMAGFWGSDFVNVGPLGHVNSASGHGPWHMGWRSLRRFMRPTRSARHHLPSASAGSPGERGTSIVCRRLPRVRSKE